MNEGLYALYISGVAVVAGIFLFLSRRYYESTIDSRSALTQRILERRRQRREELLNEEQTKRKEEILKNIIVKKVVESDFGIDRSKEITLKDISEQRFEQEYDEEAAIDSEVSAQSMSSCECTEQNGISIDISNDDTSIDNTVDTAILKLKQCPICFDDFQVGDDICFSRNKACSHTFRLDCMMDWLMKHGDCPLCRTDYLMDSNSTSKEEN